MGTESQCVHQHLECASTERWPRPADPIMKRLRADFGTKLETCAIRRQLAG